MMHIFEALGLRKVLKVLNLVVVVVVLGEGQGRAPKSFKLLGAHWSSPVNCHQQSVPQVCNK